MGWTVSKIAGKGFNILKKCEEGDEENCGHDLNVNIKLYGTIPEEKE
jgi:hypothetical protein